MQHHFELLSQSQVVALHAISTREPGHRVLVINLKDPTAAGSPQVCSVLLLARSEPCCLALESGRTGSTGVTNCIEVNICCDCALQTLCILPKAQETSCQHRFLQTFLSASCPSYHCHSACLVVHSFVKHGLLQQWRRQHTSASARVGFL